MEKYTKQNQKFVIILTGCTLVLILAFFGLKSSGESSLLPLLGEKEVQSGLPVRLMIPSIGVDAFLESVGLTTEGAMDVPKDPANVAWFELGPLPGETGSAVIAGHYGWKDKTPAVFDDLHTLQNGDEIYVEDETGKQTVFVVRELRSYGEYEDATDVFSSIDDKSHLNLVTCEGVWNKSSQSYSKRLVVFTDKK